MRVKKGSDFMIENYTREAIPKRCVLEGTGIQYVYALHTSEAQIVMNKLLSDGHDAYLMQECCLENGINPKDYMVTLTYIGGERYLLEKCR